MSYKIYSFSYNNPTRFNAMNERFSKVGKEINWITPVLSNDVRVIEKKEMDARTTAIMYNHLDMIAEFLKGEAEFGIFCEDDIYIRKTFCEDIGELINGYNKLGLDVLLLGYLIDYKMVNGHHALMEPKYLFLSVYHDLWGSQMYMMNRKTARKILEHVFDGPFSPDWTITKYGKVACIYPMLGVEIGEVATNHEGQISYHKRCKEMNYDSNNFY